MSKPIPDPGQIRNGLEDRRGEYTDMEHLLMQLGLMPPPEQDKEFRAQQNPPLQPGEWLDYEDPNRKLALSPLGLDAGANDLDNQFAHSLILQGKFRK